MFDVSKKKSIRTVVITMREKKTPNSTGFRFLIEKPSETKPPFSPAYYATNVSVRTYYDICAIEYINIRIKYTRDISKYGRTVPFPGRRVRVHKRGPVDIEKGRTKAGAKHLGRGPRTQDGNWDSRLLRRLPRSLFPHLRTSHAITYIAFYYINCSP